MFNLESSLRITKELLLSKYTQENYFEFYLGIPIKKGLFCSPGTIRVDKTPTCSFYKNKNGDLIYKDFAGPSFNFIGCVMHLFNCSYYHALRIIANDFGFIEVVKLDKNIRKLEYTGYILKETEKAKIQVEVKDFSQEELKWWSAFGISLKTLNKFRVFSIKSIFLNGNYFNSSTTSSPIFGYYGGVDSEDNELWRIYMPKKRNYRFMSNWDSTLLQGSKQLPKEDTHCFIIKSLKDTMLLYEHGLTACAPTSENIVISDAQMNKILSKFDNNVLVWFDNDLPGVRGANKYKKKYGSRCIFIKRKYAKDISDLYKKVSNSVFWKIIEELNIIINDKNVKNTKHFYIF